MDNNSSVLAAHPSSFHMRLSSIARLLGGYLYRYGSEIQLHEALAQVIGEAGYDFKREHVLDARNRADFWIEGIVVEVKVGGSLAQALRQVDRYIQLPQVHGVVLASTERWALQELLARPTWQCKAFQMIRLGRQAL